jgi:hypothetical protein
VSLDLSRLENVRKRIGKIVARCPACAEQNHDQKGDHLAIFPDGSFACVANPGAAGHKHRRRIFALASDPVLRKRGACVVRVRRPAGAKLPQVAGTVVDLSQLGTAGTPFFDLRDTGRRNTGDGGDTELREQPAYRDRNSKKPSHPSQDIPPQRRQAPPPECGDPLMSKALTVFGDPRLATPAAQDTDPETGYPIIDGAICPF